MTEHGTLVFLKSLNKHSHVAKGGLYSFKSRSIRQVHVVQCSNQQLSNAALQISGVLLPIWWTCFVHTCQGFKILVHVASWRSVGSTGKENRRPNLVGQAIRPAISLLQLPVCTVQPLLRCWTSGFHVASAGFDAAKSPMSILIAESHLGFAEIWHATRDSLLGGSDSWEVWGPLLRAFQPTAASENPLLDRFGANLLTQRNICAANTAKHRVSDAPQDPPSHSSADKCGPPSSSYETCAPLAKGYILGQGQVLSSGSWYLLHVKPSHQSISFYISISAEDVFSSQNLKAYFGACCHPERFPLLHPQEPLHRLASGYHMRTHVLDRLIIYRLDLLRLFP